MTENKIMMAMISVSLSTFAGVIFLPIIIEQTNRINTVGVVGGALIKLIPFIFILFVMGMIFTYLYFIGKE